MIPESASWEQPTPWSSGPWGVRSPPSRAGRWQRVWQEEETARAGSTEWRLWEYSSPRCTKVPSEGGNLWLYAEWVMFIPYSLQPKSKPINILRAICIPVSQPCFLVFLVFFMCAFLYIPHTPRVLLSILWLYSLTNWSATHSSTGYHSMWKTNVSLSLHNSRVSCISFCLILFSKLLYTLYNPHWLATLCLLYLHVSAHVHSHSGFYSLYC